MKKICTGTFAVCAPLLVAEGSHAARARAALRGFGRRFSGPAAADASRPLLEGFPADSAGEEAQYAQASPLQPATRVKIFPWPSPSRNPLLLRS